MATFHDLQHIVKDTIAVDAKQRYTPQEVKFINRNNEFYGTFHGKVDATKLLVSNAELSGCTIFDENGISVDVSKLGKSQEEIKELIGKLNGEVYDLSTNTKKWISDAVSESSGSLADSLTKTISTVSTDLDVKITKLDGTVTEISNSLDERVAKNEDDIKEIKERQVGAVSYQGIMRVLDSDSTFHDVFFRNFKDHATSSSEDIDSKKLEKGWMWCIQTDDKKKHYEIEGEFLEFGDFIVINDPIKVKDVEKKYVDILDMMDFDLSCDTGIDFNSVNPVQNKVIANELESLKQIMTGIDEKVEHVDGVLSALPSVDGYSKNQVVRVESENGIKRDYILCKTDDDKKYWKQYVVDGIFERHEFKDQYSETSEPHELTSYSKAAEQLSDSNRNYPSSMLVKKVYEDLLESDRKLDALLRGEIDDRKNVINSLSDTVDEKISTTRTALEDADSENFKILSDLIDVKVAELKNSDLTSFNELTSLINKEADDRRESDKTVLDEVHRLHKVCVSELTGIYSELTSYMESETNARLTSDIALQLSIDELEDELTTLLSAERHERKEADEGLSAWLNDLSVITGQYHRELTASIGNLKTYTDNQITDLCNNLSDILKDEIERSICVDNDLSSRLITEEMNREREDNKLLTAFTHDLEIERSERISCDDHILTSLLTAINDVDSDLQQYKEKTDLSLENESRVRLTSDNELCSLIFTERENRLSSDHWLSTELTSMMDEGFTNVLSSLAYEMGERTRNDYELSSELSAYKKDNDGRVKELSDKLSTEKDERTKADSAFTAEIENIYQNLVGSVTYKGHLTLSTDLSTLSIS